MLCGTPTQMQVFVERLANKFGWRYVGAVVVVYGFQQGWSQSWSMIAQYWYMLDPRPEVRPISALASGRDAHVALSQPVKCEMRVVPTHVYGGGGRACTGAGVVSDDVHHGDAVLLHPLANQGAVRCESPPDAPYIPWYWGDRCVYAWEWTVHLVKTDGRFF
jgi:hypothetical protein